MLTIYRLGGNNKLPESFKCIMWFINDWITVMPVNIFAENTLEMGRIIWFHRKAAGLSRINLADIAGVGKTVVFDIENGKETVRLNTLIKILSALNILISLDSPLMERYKAGGSAEG